MSTLAIRTRERRFPVAPHLYGAFFEEINRAGDGGLYAELLRNRAFEDSIPPERVAVSPDGTAFTTAAGWTTEFNRGEGLSSWLGDIDPTPIPGWTMRDATVLLERDDTLNRNRLASLRVGFEAGGSIENHGFHGIPVARGEQYTLTVFATAEGAPTSLTVALASAEAQVSADVAVVVATGGYARYDLTLTGTGDAPAARLVVRAPEGGTVRFGFTSLLPATTYKGHGLRPDLVRMLAELRPAFLRFPGGCVVEGFSRETAMRFPHTVGPVWERPSHHLMWGYRTTNGLGFHEYLQLCEDLGAEPVYVVNCGMTCQTRGCELFHGAELDELLQDAFDAIEYAIGDAPTPWGSRRAAAGHPEPFRLTYLEIGNENSGPEYLSRYSAFLEALSERHPQIRYIANEHTERAGLPAEIVAEHLYDTVDFFAERTTLFDAADRTGPELFVGEYAANAGMEQGTLRSALGEAMFLLGIENNQDIVTLTSYAPLFENVHYVAWSPNLIAFDGTRVHGIPAYHALRMLAAHRGEHVVHVDLESPTVHRQSAGLPAIISTRGGLQFRNATLDGRPVEPSHLLQGAFDRDGATYTAVEGDDTGIRLPFPGAENLHRIVGTVFGDAPIQAGTFEVEIKAADDVPFTIGVWTNAQRGGGGTESWTIKTVDLHGWSIDGDVSSVQAGRLPPVPLADDVRIDIDHDRFNTYAVVSREDGFDCLVNGRVVQTAVLPSYPAAMASATVDDSTVIVKVVNIAALPDDVEIRLDVPVADEYTVELLTGPRDAVNTLDDPEAVSPVTVPSTGAAQRFTYTAPPFSLSILTLSLS